MMAHWFVILNTIIIGNITAKKENELRIDVYHKQSLWKKHS